MYNPITDIDKRIADLEQLKKNYQQLPQQTPINIFNGNMTQFEARYLNDNDKVEEILVQHKTCFIDLKNRFIAIKEINGDITKYEILIPKTEEQLKIEELERKLNEYERIYTTSNEKPEPTTNDNEQYDTTTKNDSRNVFKKSK